MTVRVLRRWCKRARSTPWPRCSLHSVDEPPPLSTMNVHWSGKWKQGDEDEVDSWTFFDWLDKSPNCVCAFCSRASSFFGGPPDQPSLFVLVQ
jgi:hypothetical protein